MKNNHRKYLFVTLGIAIVGIASLGWTGINNSRSFNSYQDTVPSRQKSTKPSSKEPQKDFDKEILEIERAIRDVRNQPDVDMEKIQVEIDAAMKKVDEEMAKHKIDMEKMQKELNASLSKIDMEKMNADLKRSLKEFNKLDLEKLQKELKESLSDLPDDDWKEDLKASLKQLDKIDMEKMRKEIEASVKDIKVNIDAEDISRKVRESIEKIDLDKVKVDMDKVREEMNKNKNHMYLDTDEMHKDLEKAKKELKGYQEMVYEMEKDGLLKTSGDYKIEYKQGEIMINGKKQPVQVINKYKKYFSKDGVTIKKEKGEMNINIQ